MGYNLRKNKIIGFTLIELVVAVAMAAILGSVGVAVYRKHIVQVNQDSTRQNMITWVTSFEQYYAIYGTYATKNGAIPSTIAQILREKNSFYRFAVYSKDANENGLNPNTQSICLIAFPLASTVMKGTGTIIVDNFGNARSGSTDTYIAPSMCGSEAKLSP